MMRRYLFVAALLAAMPFSAQAVEPDEMLGDPFSRAVFERLRERRLELAREQGVPPYVIFHDAILAAIAERRPTDLAELSLISGMGATKIERYGAEVIAIIEAMNEAA